MKVCVCERECVCEGVFMFVRKSLRASKRERESERDDMRNEGV